MTLNKILVIGNVGTDPEMRYTPNGNPVTSFRLATNRRYTTSEGEQREETEWFTITAWNKLAEQCNQYVTKGMKIYAEGRLKSDSWTGNDGQMRFRNEIVANEVRFLDRATPEDTSRNEITQPQTNEITQPQTSEGEDLPW
tara:strand:+ start:18011 stop:18433 length:423 start_codon:yes stop_codon:yes gene_type:complete